MASRRQAANWQCRKCDTYNAPSDAECIGCDTARPEVGESGELTPAGRALVAEVELFLAAQPAALENPPLPQRPPNPGRHDRDTTPPPNGRPHPEVA